MSVIRAIVALLFVGAVVAAVAVGTHSTPVANAGDQVGYVPPPSARQLAVIGDSWSDPAGTAMGGAGDANWASLLAVQNAFTLDNQSVSGTGYFASGLGAKSFPARAKLLVKNATADPYLIIVWDAWDDFHTSNPSVADITTGMRQTLHILKKGFPNANIVAVGPVAVDSNTDHKVNGIIAQANAAEGQLATKMHVPYFSPTDEGWFLGDNAGFIGNNGEDPTDVGNLQIYAEMQNDLRSIAGRRKIAYLAGAASSSPQAPYIPTVTQTSTPPPSTVTRTSVAVRTSIARVTATVRQVVTATVIISGGAPTP